ncbi:hypothetical protein [Lacticaseibacillus absianus]|uniref:hypothetical protein n=1 Tax=Lacticaseibacillus absianus TaxID=2729623 RepID=UPI0015CACC4B|nr:hypothetical protein [Lacticaseibacillus absianus]
MKKGKLLAAGVAAMLLTVVSGCGGSSSAKSDNDSKQKDFEVLVVRYPDQTEKYHTDGVVPDTAKAAGVNIKFRKIAALSWSDKKSVIMAGNKLPDAFMGLSSLQDADITANKASLIPLEKYITKKTMPNLYKLMKEDKKLRAISTDADGHIYSLPAKYPDAIVYSDQTVINKAWLDKLNIKMPTTYKEYQDAIVKMVNGDPNGNGKKDELGISGWSNLVFLPWGLTASTSQIGGMSYDGHKLIFDPVTKDYKKIITQLHKTFQQGGIDQELFTQGFTDIINKTQKGTKVVSTVAQLPNGVGDDYVATPAITGVDGKKHAHNNNPSYARNEFEVTTACKNPAKLLNWIDRFYEPENSVQAVFGPIGDEFVKKNADGSYQLLPDPTHKFSQVDYELKNAFRTYAPVYFDDALNAKIKTIPTEGDGLKQKIQAPVVKYQDPEYPILSYTDAESKELSKLNTDISGLTGQKEAEWITKGGVDKEWDAYIQQLNDMGLKRFMEIQNKALKRYNKTLGND